MLDYSCIIHSLCEAEVSFQPTRTSKPFTGLRRNTVVWKASVDIWWKAPHPRPESNETTIPDNPPRIPALSLHYPVTIWRRRSESNRCLAPFQKATKPLRDRTKPNHLPNRLFAKVYAATRAQSRITCACLRVLWLTCLNSFRSRLLTFLLTLPADSRNASESIVGRAGCSG